MCRLSGLFNANLSEQALMAKVGAMCTAMQRGGPDDEGFHYDKTVGLGLGFRRLSLLDLSSNGHQPMQSADGRTILLFNGEVYNFLDLKQELVALGCHFKSGTDTEVVLHGWQQWGTQCFNRLNGMWAMAIWEPATGSLLLARDHAGMKPLYYHLDPQKKCLQFASETRAFTQSEPNWPEHPDWRMLFLAYGHMPAPFTTLKEVWSVPKGTYLRIHLPSMQVEQECWYREGMLPAFTDAASAQQALQSALEAAVARHQVADAPLGVFLSGGLDSSLLTLLAANNKHQQLVTLSIDFEDVTFSEKRYQRLVAEKAASKHHTFTITQQDFQASMPDILQAMDQPSNDGINSYFISRYAKEAGLKAVISGIGGDELFGGYPSFKRNALTQKLKGLGALLGWSEWLPGDRFKRLGFLQYPQNHATYLFGRGYFTPLQIAAITGNTVTYVLQVLQLSQSKTDQIVPTGHPLEQVSQMEQDFYLQNQLLRDTDAMSMWHGVEVRIPFLDREIMDVCRRTPPHLRFMGPQPKQWLSNTFQNLLPATITQRKKMGFTFPFSKWMQKVTIYGAVTPQLFHYQQLFAKGSLQWSRYWVYLLSTSQPIGLQQPMRKILFATLKTFSAMGGIEKFNRCYSMALQQNALKESWQVTVASVYDTTTDTRYFPSSGFLGFSHRKFAFIAAILRHLRHYDSIVLGHINLGFLQMIGQRWYPSIRWKLITHGVEVWEPLKGVKKWALVHATRIAAVSDFTRQKMLQYAPNIADKTSIFPNTIDPLFLKDPVNDGSTLKTPEGWPAGNQVILTISRLASTERYKGYDAVLEILPDLLVSFPKLKYVLGGSGDAKELARIKAIIHKNGLQDAVYLPGFIAEKELAAWYKYCSVFVMPSRKEGFGIVFLEAAWQGAKIIAGNADGSVEALLHGKLGQLIDPDDPNALHQALLLGLQAMPTTFEETAYMRNLVDYHFGFRVFAERQKQAIEQLATENKG